MTSSERKHSLLTEIWRPDSLEGFVGSEKLKKDISKQIEENDIQNYIFYGPPGSGKTTLAKIIINNLDCESLFLNATDERGIETMRDKIQSFASMASFSPLKIVVLDEADFLLQASQGILRHIIEKFSKSTRFIFTCNYIEKIMEPLQSRCQVVKVVPPSKSMIAEHLSNICEVEEIKFDMKDLASVIQNSYPDIRKMLNTIQSNSKTGTLVLDNSLIVSSNYTDKVIKELSKDKPSFKLIRQIIVDSNENSFEELFRDLYDRAEEFMPGKEGTLAILINDSSYKANFSLDKEINAAALIQNIINNKK